MSSSTTESNKAAPTQFLETNRHTCAYRRFGKVVKSYRVSENLPNAVLLTYPDAGHGSLFQYPESFTRHAAEFLCSPSESAVF